LRDRAWIACIVALVPFAAACGTGTMTVDASAQDAGASDAAAVCPRDLPASCPSPAPSYASTVLPILESRCVPCHAAGGTGASKGHEYTSYARIFADRGSILNQVYGCRMPPPEAAAPLPPERAALLAWLVCGAPNN
jgi:hypothetical protein